MINKKETKGITLIALIITVIVLLILAGVAISSITGDGLFARIKKASDEAIKAQGKEYVELIIQKMNLDKLGNVSLEDIKTDIMQYDDAQQIEYVYDIENNGLQINHVNGFTYTINKDLSITTDKKAIEIDFNPDGKVGTTTATTVVAIKGTVDTENIYYQWNNSIEILAENNPNWIRLNEVEANQATTTGIEISKDISEGEVLDYYLWIKAQDMEGKVLIKRTNKFCKTDTIVGDTIVGINGIIADIRNIEIPDGEYDYVLEEKSEAYKIIVKNFYDDVNYTTSPIIETTEDGPMVVLKYHKNLTIESGVTLTPCERTKGMYICVKGTLTNKGTISMTARGASGEGQNVYLWKNANESYEFIPKIGAFGANNVSATSADIKYSFNGSNGYHKYGIDGSNGVGRQTGGGGSGSSTIMGAVGTISGKGSAGTSYSGGSGGGGAVTRDATVAATDGVGGGIGGNGAVNTNNATTISWAAAGGAGIIGGYGKSRGAKTAPIVTETGVGYIGESGTGGLLLMYAGDFINMGTISSNGSKGGGMSGVDSPGGSSGGGSINIFYQDNFSNTSVIEAKGGVAITYSFRNATRKGSQGGNGAISIGSIKTGIYVAD